MLPAPLVRTWLVKASGALQSGERTRSTWLRSSLVEVGQPGSRVPGAYLRHAPAWGVIMKPCGHDHGELNQMSRPHRSVGHAETRVASWPCPTSRGVVGEATDLTVAQAVVDEREQMTRRGDASDVAASASADTGLDRGDLRIAHGTRDGLDGSPAQQP